MTPLALAVTTNLTDDQLSAALVRLTAQGRIDRRAVDEHVAPSQVWRLRYRLVQPGDRRSAS